jgi:hypothetical protein
MSVIFKLKDVLHRVTVKLFPAYLPDARKPYIARAVYQPELDIHGIASKAKVYDITTPPEVIEKGFLTALELIYYLTADGYKIRTPLFNLRIGIPGEYEEYDTHLPDGLSVHALLNVAPEFRKYLGEKVRLQFDGIDQRSGFIATIIDKFSETTNTCITPGRVYIIRGGGLKITSDTEHVNDTGLYYENAATGVRIREDMRNIAQNEPQVISAQSSSDLPPADYYIVIRTQSLSKTSGRPLKNVREVKSDFTVTVPSNTTDTVPSGTSDTAPSNTTEEASQP